MDNKDIKEELSYALRCAKSMELAEYANLNSAARRCLSKEIASRIQTVLQEIDMNTDGGSGSGNWGHVGVIGQHGGSAPGGGKGFRMVGTGTPGTAALGEYTSKAKIQATIREGLKSSDRKTRTIAEMRRAVTDMTQKSARNLIAKGTYSTTASKDILADKSEGKNATEYGNNVSGTLHAVKALEKHSSANATNVPQIQTPKVTETTSEQTNTSQESTAEESSEPTVSDGLSSKNAGGTDVNVTTRPTDNPNYQKALSIMENGTTADQKAFYNEAKQNATLQEGDTSSNDNGNIQKLVNYMGLTDKPTLVDQAKFDELKNADGAVTIYRGTQTQEDANRFMVGDSNRMGGIAYGSGVYFGCSVGSAYGTDVQAVVKPDAKVLTVNSTHNEWTTRDSNGNVQWQKAIMAGYDMVRIQRGSSSYSGQNSNSDYMLVFNRGALNCLDQVQ